MKNILSQTKTAIILLFITVLLLGSYVYMIARPISYGMSYYNSVVYEGVKFEGEIRFNSDGTVLSKNTNFEEPIEMYYYYKDGYVFTLVAKNEEERASEIAYINENFDEAIATPLYASKTSAFKQVAVGLDEEVTTYTCTGAIIFAIVGGIDRLLLIALTAYSFVLSKKAKNN